MKRIYLACSVALLLTAVVGCSSHGKREAQSLTFANYTGSTPSNAVTLVVTNEAHPELLRPSDAPFTLGPGDRLEIELLGTANSRAVTRVGPDGKIYYNLLPGMDVWGLTLAQTRDLLQKELTKYVTDPQLTVTLREVGSKRVWLLGRLNRPGVYAMPAPMSLLEALAQAGGTASSGNQVTLQDLADLRHSFVMRQGQSVPVDFHRLVREGDLSQNIFLQPDDFVYVPSALSQQVYVLGAVRYPRAMPYTDGMTLVSALAGASGATTVDWFVPGYNNSVAYGPQPDAYLSHVGIVRGSLSEPRMTVVNYGAIIKGRAQDVALEPGDIIYVPNTPLSTPKRYLNMIVNSFVTTMAANNGIAAAGGTGTVSVSVPVGTSSGTSTGAPVSAP
jgi:protein involved in polysaccharide export with SLBB domain